MGKQKIDKCNEIVFGHRSTPQPHSHFEAERKSTTENTHSLSLCFSPPSLSLCRSSPARCRAACLTGCLFVCVLSGKLTRSQNEYENICIGVPRGPHTAAAAAAAARTLSATWKFICHRRRWQFGRKMEHEAITRSAVVSRELLDVPWWCWTRVANRGTGKQMICKIKMNGCTVLVQ